MAIDWVKGFFIPIIELVIIGGLIIFILFVVIRASLHYYNTRLRWFLKYSIMRKKYDDTIVSWILNAIRNDIDYWTAKKTLLCKGIEMRQVNEMMYIYDNIYKQLQGGKNDGQRIARSNSQVKSAKSSNLPTDFKTY